MADKITIGTKYFHEFSFSQADVQSFADLTGDHNPIHLDAEFAAQSIFKQRIIHGHLSSSVFTRFLGMEKPGGPGSIYMKQVTEYLRPMYVDVKYQVVFEVMEIDEIKHVAQISTQIINIETGKITIKGTGTLMNTQNF
jgi:acyl dehydratase